MKNLAMMAGALCVMGTVLPAQEWQVEMRIDPPVAYTTSYSGTISSYGTGARGEHFGNVEAFRGPDVPNGTPCEQVDWFEIDFFFGEDSHHELQFLFGLEHLPGDIWRVDSPAAFINMGSSDDPYAVVLEQYEGPQVTLTEFACLPDGGVRVGIDYAFAGPPQSDKGPEWLSLHGSASASMTLYNYDQY